MARFTVTVGMTTLFTHDFEAGSAEEAKKTALEVYAEHGSEAFDYESTDGATVLECREVV